MERIWLKQYPAGVPADIDVTQYSSLVELLEESFAKFSDRKAFICMDKSISYRDLDEMSLALGAWERQSELVRLMMRAIGAENARAADFGPIDATDSSDSKNSRSIPLEKPKNVKRPALPSSAKCG